MVHEVVQVHLYRVSSLPEPSKPGNTHVVASESLRAVSSLNNRNTILALDTILLRPRLRMPRSPLPRILPALGRINIPLLSLELHQLLMHRAGRILRLGEGRSIRRKRQGQRSEGKLHLGGWTVEQLQVSGFEQVTLAACIFIQASASPLFLSMFNSPLLARNVFEAPGRTFLEIIYSGWALEYCIGSLAVLGSSV